MTLTKFERLLLVNQFRILEKLDADGSHYEEWIEALTNGYELHYPDFSQWIFDETMTEADCEEIIDALSKFESIKYSVRDMAEKPTCEPYKMVFDGYDGNNEGKLMCYAEYYCKHDGGRFSSLEIKDFNSHAARRDRYARMVAAWGQSADKHKLTKADVERIAATR